jgi:hypothetical protein
MYSMRRVVPLFILCVIFHAMLRASTIVPANDPNIQYFGRWDFSNPLAPSHSWPGVYIYAEFQGTSIGIVTDDNACWYNVIIDGVFRNVFQGSKFGVNSYVLATGLSPGSPHSILLTKRGETSWTKFSFNGFILDDGMSIVTPQPKPTRKIEFLGDSYTSASGNEWTNADAAPNDFYSNIYLGFGPIIARHYNAQYQMTSRGGIGLVQDWQGNATNNLPSVFDRTLFYTGEPKWNFSRWIPDVAVICLGLNDYSGWSGYSGPISEENAALFRTRYHDFIATVMGEYPGTNILVVAANDLTWLKKNVSQVAAEENAMGHTNVHFAYFPYYNGGYVNNGHPTVATHQRIADTLIYAIDTMNIWVPYKGTVAPKITQAPVSGFTVYDTVYMLNVVTDTYATLRYSTQDKSYTQMEYTFTSTGKRSHSVAMPCRHGMKYTYYVRGKGIYGDVMDSSLTIQFSVDTTKAIIRWTASAYDHSHWKTGKSPLGSPTDSSVATRTDTAKTVYYYSTFNVTGFDRISTFSFKIIGHDGMVVYLNGKEFARINMSGDPMTYESLALQSMQVNQSLFLISESGLLHEGLNTMAVEVHSAMSVAPSTIFNATLQDDTGPFHLTTGSIWSYFDGGKMPPDLIVNKPTVGVSDRTEGKPANPKLYANYPNPFNPETTFKFDLSAITHVRLSVFNMLGQEIAVVLDGQKDAGRYTVQFSAAHLASGVYFYRMATDSYFATKKMIVLK